MTRLDYFAAHAPQCPDRFIEQNTGKYGSTVAAMAAWAWIWAAEMIKQTPTKPD